MPKISINIDSNFQKFARGADTLRGQVRAKVHQPEHRATTRTLLAIGLVTIALAVAKFIYMH